MATILLLLLACGQNIARATQAAATDGYTNLVFTAAYPATRDDEYGATYCGGSTTATGNCFDATPPDGGHKVEILVCCEPDASEPCKTTRAPPI